MARGGGKPQPTITDDRALGAADIQRSLRFNASNTNLTRTSSSASTTFTYSAWIKRCGFSGYQYIFSMAGRGFSFHTNNQTLYLYDATNLNESTAKFRDSTAWYHIVVQINSGTATSYVNNVLVHNAVGGGAFTLTTGANETRIGSYSENEYDFDGYMAEINLVDGSVVAPTEFGFTDSQTGIWMPKRYEGSYGTNGFYLDFSDNTSTTTLGIDKSPNGNDFTLNNFDVNDSVKDTPTNAFCTMNVLDKSAGTQLTATNGNLRVYTSHGFRTMRGTFGVSSGKWYWESRLISWASSFIGITSGDEDITGTGRGGETSNSATIRQNTGNLRTNGSDASYGNSQADGDILGFALDMDNGKFYIAENGTWYNSGDPANGTNAGKTGLTGTVFPSAAPYDGKSCYFNFGQDDTFDGNETSQGNTDGNGHGKFKYAPPTGFLSLCTANLPKSTSILKPQRHFDTLLYTATGNAMSVTGLEFKPDLIWQKRRDSTGGSHYHYLFDSIRGGRYGLQANTSGAEFDSTNNSNIVFKDGGFDMAASDGGQGNAASGTYVAWCWKAGGAAVANTDGDQTTQVSVNEEAGFSIVTYTGTGSNTNIGHGLGGTPDIVITKSRSATGSWAVLDRIGNSTAEYGLFLNDNGAYSSYQGGTYWNDTLPTSTVFRVSSNAATNANGVTYVAYCWRSIPGYSKFGIYEATNNTDGPYVHLGFQPKWVMMKPVDSGGNWQIYDTSRTPVNKDDGNALYADLENSEASGFTIFDFLSTGFKNRNSGSGGINYSGTYIYMAFAEQPGTTPFDTISNAR